MRAIDIYLNNGRGLYAYGSLGRGGVIHSNGHASLSSAKASNGANRRRLPLHIEGVFMNLGLNPGHEEPGEQERDASPDILSLHYIRNPEEVPLEIAIPNWRQVSKENRALLAQPILNLVPNLPAVPILYGPVDDPSIRYNQIDFANDDTIVPDETARAALKEFDDHLHSQIVQLPVSAGSVVWIDNRRSLHGRAAYAPRYDEKRRWLRRILLSIDSERIRQFETTGVPRIIDTAPIHEP